MRMAVLWLRVEVEGEGAWEPGVTADDDDDDGSGGGMATSQPSTRKQYTRFSRQGKSTGRLMVVVRSLWLTVRGRVVSSMQKHAYPIGSLMWLCPLLGAQNNLLNQKPALSINK